MKQETRVDGPWKDTDEEVYIPRQIREIQTLRPWQAQVIGSLNEWDTRTIHCIHDPVGNNGKTIMCQWVRCHRLGRIIPALNCGKDLMRAVMNMPKARAYVVDLPRAMNKGKLAEMFSAIEQIKMGFCFDDRYKFQDDIFDSPNIWVCTNSIPDPTYVSMDRWKFWKIVDNELVKFRPSVEDFSTHEGDVGNDDF